MPSMSMSVSGVQDTQAELSSTVMSASTSNSSVLISSSESPSNVVLSSISVSSVEVLPTKSASTVISPSRSISRLIVQPSKSMSNERSPSNSMPVSNVVVQASESLSMTLSPNISASIVGGKPSLTPSMSPSTVMSLRVSPSRSQSTVVSTSIAVVPVTEDTVYEVLITIERNFTEDLNSQSSEAFTELARQIVGYLTEICSGDAGFIEAKVISFSRGSVVANTRLIFQSKSNITNIFENANVTGNNTLQVIRIKVTRIERTRIEHTPISSSHPYITKSASRTIVISPARQC